MIVYNRRCAKYENLSHRLILRLYGEGDVRMVQMAEELIQLMGTIYRLRPKLSPASATPDEPL